MTTLSVNSNVDCKIIQKTCDFIFFDKGSGVHSVAQDFGEMDTAANWLLSVDEALSDVSVPLESGLLHRLDFETSGVMVAARNKGAFAYLKELFKKNQVTKEYVCLVAPRRGEPVARPQPLQPGKYVAYAYGRGKHSKKVIVGAQDTVPDEAKKIVTEIIDVSNGVENSFHVTLRIETGFRHQIRAHLAFLGFPLVGDKLYGGASAKRLMLHARCLEFLGMDGKSIKIESREKF